MAKLKIENFGPIKSLELDFKKYNILIGSQGAGKSCILKIVSFCAWVEKKSDLGHNENFKDGKLDKDFIQDCLLNYYKLSDYAEIKEYNYSKIEYWSDNDFKIWIDFKIKDKKWITIVPGNSKLSTQKNAYIPTERCLVSAIPNLYDIRFHRNTSLYEYIRDFEFAKKLYTPKNKLQILDLNAKFYYDEKKDQSFISVDNDGIIKDIHFENSASGFQSVVPICVLMNFYLSSKGSLSLKDELFFYQFKEAVLRDYNGNIDAVLKEIDNRRNDNINNPEYKIFLEEPEENIFPETQYQLVKFLVKLINSKYKSSLFISTHSPYFITSFNSLLWADNTIKEKPETKDKVVEIMGHNNFVNIDDVSAYIIKNNKVENIFDDELKQIKVEMIDEVSTIINQEYDKLMDL